MRLKLRKIRRVGMAVLGGFLLIALIAAIVFVLVSHSKGQTPFLGSYSVLWLKTDSMEPTIPQRSYILIEKADTALIREDDIISFISDDPSIAGLVNTHRVAGIIGDHEAFSTKGDRENAFEDKYPAQADKVIGKFVRDLPILSVAGRLLSTPIGIFGACFLLIVLLALGFLPDIRRINKQAEHAKEEKKEYMEQLIREEVERLKAEGEKTKENGGPKTSVNPPETENGEAPSNGNPEEGKDDQA